MNQFDTNFKKSLTWYIRWTFTENIWLRRILGLTVVPLEILFAVALSILLLPYILWYCTLKEVAEAFLEPIKLIKEWL